MYRYEKTDRIEHDFIGCTPVKYIVRRGIRYLMTNSPRIAIEAAEMNIIIAEKANPNSFARIGYKNNILRTLHNLYNPVQPAMDFISEVFPANMEIYDLIDAIADNIIFSLTDNTFSLLSAIRAEIEFRNPKTTNDNFVWMYKICTHIMRTTDLIKPFDIMDYADSLRLRMNLPERVIDSIVSSIIFSCPVGYSLISLKYKSPLLSNHSRSDRNIYDMITVEVLLRSPQSYEEYSGWYSLYLAEYYPHADIPDSVREYIHRNGLTLRRPIC